MVHIKDHVTLSTVAQETPEGLRSRAELHIGAACRNVSANFDAKEDINLHHDPETPILVTNLTRLPPILAPTPPPGLESEPEGTPPSMGPRLCLKERVAVVGEPVVLDMQN